MEILLTKEELCTDTHTKLAEQSGRVGEGQHLDDAAAHTLSIQPCI